MTKRNKKTGCGKCNRIVAPHCAEKISQTDTEMISAWLNGINAIREG
ncbi:MAG: hypothetical protein ACLT1Y_01130 [Eubacterium sp.]